MADWQEFFLAQAGAAGVLTGLVFVGVSINLEKILSQPDFGLPGRAAEALILLVAGLATSCLLLVPGQGTTMVGVEVLAVGLAAWGWVGAIQLLRLKGCQAMPPELRQAFVLRVALGEVTTLPFIAAGIAVLTGGWEACIGWRPVWSSRYSWRCSTRGRCSSRPSGRRRRGLVAALFTRVRAKGNFKAFATCLPILGTLNDLTPLPKP
jgi:modulator of FtsH protease